MGLWKRIKQVALTDVAVLVKGIDRDTLEGVERVLIEADFGPATFDLVEHLEAKLRRGELKTEDAFRGWLIDEIAGMFDGENEDTARPESDEIALAADGPTVVLLLGVNGVGKTTQAAKIAHRMAQRGNSVLLAAADTFRPGATEQLTIWANRLGLPAVTGTPVDRFVTNDLLHTESDLMTELQKIVRVVGRRCGGAPHESFLVLDGTVGQNAMQQGKLFAAAVPLSGLIVTKLDGTAKGGAVVALQREIGVPVRFLGVGEALEDLDVFEPRRFAERLLGV